MADSRYLQFVHDFFIAFWVLKDGFGLDNESNNYLHMSFNPSHWDMKSLAPSLASSSLFFVINSIFFFILLYNLRMTCLGRERIFEIVDGSLSF